MLVLAFVLTQGWRVRKTLMLFPAACWNSWRMQKDQHFGDCSSKGAAHGEIILVPATVCAHTSKHSTTSCVISCFSLSIKAVFCWGRRKEGFLFQTLEIHDIDMNRLCGKAKKERHFSESRLAVMTAETFLNLLFLRYFTPVFCWELFCACLEF